MRSTCPRRCRALALRHALSSKVQVRLADRAGQRRA
jgi:hypothetical protein